ncbi:hypothetical protein RI367_008448 [Sorochytrium milnesiophthora]
MSSTLPAPTATPPSLSSTPLSIPRSLSLSQHEASPSLSVPSSRHATPATSTSTTHNKSPNGRAALLEKPSPPNEVIALLREFRALTDTLWTSILQLAHAPADQQPSLALPSAHTASIIKCNARLREALARLEQHQRNHDSIETLDAALAAENNKVVALMHSLTSAEQSLRRTLGNARNTLAVSQRAEQHPFDPDMVVNYAAKIAASTSAQRPPVVDKDDPFAHLPQRVVRPYPEEPMMRGGVLFRAGGALPTSAPAANDPEGGAAEPPATVTSQHPQPPARTQTLEDAASALQAVVDADVGGASTLPLSMSPLDTVTPSGPSSSSLLSTAITDQPSTVLASQLPLHPVETVQQEEEEQEELDLDL